MFPPMAIDKWKAAIYTKAETKQSRSKQVRAISQVEGVKKPSSCNQYASQNNGHQNARHVHSVVVTLCTDSHARYSIVSGQPARLLFIGFLY